MQEISAILKCQHLTRRFSGPEGEIRILNGVDLTLAAGESLAIVGASGSGKSTLLGLLAGLDLPNEGKVWLAGEEMTSMDEDQRALLRAANVGFVFQSFQLLESLTAEENILMPLELAGRKNAAARTAQLLDDMGLMPRKAHYPSQMSGGEQQRVAIARAFASEPALLFADEPTGNLDGKTAAHIVELLFAQQSERGCSLVLVTHDTQLAASCDRQLQLIDGVLTT